MVRMYHPPFTSKEPPGARSNISMYSKRPAMSGIRGQLYVTKLLSLIYFRAIHDDTIQEFQLATEIDKVGAFSDIFIKAKVKGHDKPFTAFVQAKHCENKKQALKIDLATYFDSYMKIRQNFNYDLPCELLFDGKFNEKECLVVIFTNANVDFSDAPATSGISAKLNDILDMGGTVKQPNTEENIEYLTKKTVQNQITSLAGRIARFICDEQNFQIMLSDELVLRYHVILAQKVFDISDIPPLKSKDVPRCRIALFRRDFFDNNEEYIMLFRDALYLEVIKRRRMEPAEIRLCLFEFLGDPTDAARLSKLIGTVVTYNNGQLEFDNQSTKAFWPSMKPMDVSRSTVNKAVELAAIEILSTLKFNVPAAFGNKDLTFRGSDAKIDRRICYLALKIKKMLDKCKSSKIVTINESSADGFLLLNGGIAGAIGNIFVLDDNTQLMKITDNCEILESRAKSLYTKLKSEVHNLHEYKFCFKVYKFPKLSFDCNYYEENIARDFLNKILVYSNQADETDLQEILKNEIEDIQRNQPNYFQVKTDAILLSYYDEIQKWRMRPQHASYLTQRINLFRQLIGEIVQDTLMRSINLTYYTSKIQKYNYTFTENAVSSLNLQDQRSSTIIVTENSVLTVARVLQHLKNKDHVVLDLEYIDSLPTNDQNALRAELMYTYKEKVLILVCDKIDSKIEMKTLKNIAEAVKNKTNIIITDEKSLVTLIIHKYFPEADHNILRDKKFSLTDVCEESQKRIFESATVVFPGVEIKLDHLLRGWPSTGLTLAGGADAAGAADVGDKPTATGPRGFDDDDLDTCEVTRKVSAWTDLGQTFLQDSSSSPSSVRDAQLAGGADAAGAADVGDKPTATGSRGFDFDDLDLCEIARKVSTSTDLEQVFFQDSSSYHSSLGDEHGFLQLPFGSTTSPATTFSGPLFYKIYKDAEFLKIDDNVKRLLAQGYELRKKLCAVKPGNAIVVEGMNLDQKTPLVIKKTDSRIKLEAFEFTYNRLVGLAAGYAYDNRYRFPSIVSSEAEALGLVWDRDDDVKCKLYLSAVSGAEHFTDQFSFYPLLCGMRKYQLKKLPVQLVVKISSIRNAAGQTMANALMNNYVTAERIWLMFPGSSQGDLLSLIKDTPELMKLFHNTGEHWFCCP